MELKNIILNNRLFKNIFLNNLIKEFSNAKNKFIEKMAQTTNETGPEYYRRGSIQVWDFVRDKELNFHLGNCNQC